MKRYLDFSQQFILNKIKSKTDKSFKCLVFQNKYNTVINISIITMNIEILHYQKLCINKYQEV